MSEAIVDIATSNPAAVFRADEVVTSFPTDASMWAARMAIP